MSIANCVSFSNYTQSLSLYIIVAGITFLGFVLLLFWHYYLSLMLWIYIEKLLPAVAIHGHETRLKKTNYKSIKNTVMWYVVVTVLP